MFQLWLQMPMSLAQVFCFVLVCTCACIDYILVVADFPPVDGDGSQHDDFDAGRGHEFSHDGEHHDHDHNSRHHHGDHHKRPEDMNGDFDGKDSWRHDSGDLDEYGEGHDGHDGHDHDDHDGHKHGHGNQFLFWNECMTVTYTA